MIDELLKFIQTNPAAAAPVMSAVVSIVVTVIVKSFTAMAERSKSDAANENADAVIKTAFVESTTRQIDSLQKQGRDCFDQVADLKAEIATTAAASAKAIEERDRLHAAELQSVRDQHAAQIKAQQTQIEFLQAQVQRLTEIILGKGGKIPDPTS